MELFAFKHRIERDFGIDKPIPIGILLTSPIILGIAHEIEKLGQNSHEQCHPVVPLQHNPDSRKAPLWLIHPGSDDVLIFIPLAELFMQRTVYGLRMKGLDTGLNEIDYFTTVEEMAECYVNHIKAYQPQRPYTIAGYSLGTTVAFEIAKRPEANQNEVAFLGLFDSPPYIAELIQHLDWVDVLLVNVAYFLELINENYSMVLQTDLRK